VSELTKQEQIELAWAEHAASLRQARSLLTLALRDQLCEQQNWRCAFCGVRMEGTGSEANAPTFEHIIPRSKGGSDQLENIVISCWRCNHLRGDGTTP
jgi:5-methylcytosine-specific restriction endonuclease McrA